MSKAKPSRQIQKKQLQRLLVAEQLFCKVLDCCEFLLNQIPDEHHPLYFPLVTAAVVMYAKPFGDNDGMGRIEKKYERFSREELDFIHKDTLQSRLQFYAHSDATRTMDNVSLPDGRPLPALSLVLKVDTDITPERPGGTFGVTVTEPLLRKDIVPLIAELCRELVAKLNTEIERLAKDLFRELPKESGMYWINADSDSDETVLFKNYTAIPIKPYL